MLLLANQRLTILRRLLTFGGFVGNRFLGEPSRRLLGILLSSRGAGDPRRLLDYERSQANARASTGLTTGTARSAAPRSTCSSKGSATRATMSGTPSGAANAARTPAADNNIERMLEELLARQARDAAILARRLDTMQAEIDSRAPALDTLHAGAAAPAAAIAAPTGEAGWLRRIVGAGRSPAAPSAQQAAAHGAADSSGTPAPSALAPRSS